MGCLIDNTGELGYPDLRMKLVFLPSNLSDLRTFGIKLVACGVSSSETLVLLAGLWMGQPR